MPGSDLFTLIAEVAFGFTGFAGLAGVLATQQVRTRVALRFWIMIEFGLATLLFAILPLVLHAADLAAPLVWAIGSGTVAGFLLLHMAVLGRRIVGAWAEGTWQLGLPALDVSFPVVMVLCLVTQLLNVLGVLFERSVGGLATGLFLLLVLSGLNFVALLMAMRLETAGAAPSSAERPASGPPVA